MHLSLPQQPVKSAPGTRFEVFFDGDCPICRREIEMIRRKDRQNRLVLTDISAADFNPSDRPLEELMKEIHGRFPDGSYLVGVQVFREIYRRLGYGKIVRFTEFPLVGKLLELAYFAFARIRFRRAMVRLRKRKSRQAQNGCDSTHSSCHQISV